jgi:transcriptional regulator with XRE-family HTH domain
MAEGPFEGLGATLRALREERGLTLEEAGRRAQVSISNLSRYERGATEPTLRVLGRILVAYEVDARKLVERMGSTKEESAHPVSPSPQEDVEDPILEAVRGALKRLGYTPEKDRAEGG